MRLYRATSATCPHLRFGTCWATTYEHAEHYTQMAGFGGPAIYAVDVDVDPSEVLDLTGDAVAKMAERGFDLCSQSEVEWLPGEIVRLGRLLGGSWGHRWWLFDVDEPGVCWLYLGVAALPAALLVDKPWTEPASHTS